MTSSSDTSATARTSPSGASGETKSAETSSENVVDFRGPKNRRLGRENYQEKAQRLLASGRVNVLRVDREAGVYEASVRGDSAMEYLVRWDRDATRFTCPCKAFGVCSHIRAAQLIFVVGGLA